MDIESKSFEKTKDYVSLTISRYIQGIIQRGQWTIGKTPKLGSFRQNECIGKLVFKKAPYVLVSPLKYESFQGIRIDSLKHQIRL
jgi:hypothetical protein